MTRRIALGTFWMALATRLAYGWHNLIFPAAASSNDTVIYRHLAAALVHGRFPSLFRTPGYPLFLALTGGFPNSGVTVTLLAQMLLDSLTAVLLAMIAWRLWRSSSAALLAGLLYALCPIAATLSGMLLSEPLSVFLVV